MPPASRPQTLKQAKRAYQRNGPARPSASDIAQAERRVALQERADRIKDREARRKANLKKRNEKIAREREAAKEAGKPFIEDQKPHWKVGASQLRLGGFLNGIRKIREPDHSKLSAKEIREAPEDFAPGKQTGAAQSSSLPQDIRLPAHSSLDESVRVYLRKQSPISSARQMPPPPIPIPQRQAEMLGESFEDCFPSNTQVQRELSPECCKATTAANMANSCDPLKSCVKTDTLFDAMNANDFLACMSTPDLNVSGTPDVAVTKDDDSDLLAQISTQDLDFGDPSPKPAVEANLVDPEQLLAEISTQDLDFSQEAIEVRTEINSAKSESFADFDLESFVMECGLDGFELTLENPTATC